MESHASPEGRTPEPFAEAQRVFVRFTTRPHGRSSGGWLSDIKWTSRNLELAVNERREKREHVAITLRECYLEQLQVRSRWQKRQGARGQRDPKTFSTRHPSAVDVERTCSHHSLPKPTKLPNL